jgi:hypothetical protein
VVCCTFRLHEEGWGVATIVGTAEGEADGAAGEAEGAAGEAEAEGAAGEALGLAGAGEAEAAAPQLMEETVMVACEADSQM